MDKLPCDYCDGFGSAKTYRNQAKMPINGRVQCIDWCIHHIVAALNAGGVQTTDSCCGHEKMPGYIALKDGRVLAIFSSGEEARMYDSLENNEHNHLIENNPQIWQPPRLDGTRGNYQDRSYS